MKLEELKPFKAELVALGGTLGAAIAAVADHTFIAIIMEAPAVFATYGKYIKGNATKEEVATAVVEEAAK